jgi:hypothetical protein
MSMEKPFAEEVLVALAEDDEGELSPAAKRALAKSLASAPADRREF